MESQAVVRLNNGSRVVVNASTGEVLRECTLEEHLDFIREKNGNDSLLRRPGGKRMRGDDYSADAIGWNVFCDQADELPEYDPDWRPQAACPEGECETCDAYVERLRLVSRDLCDPYEMPEIVIPNERERVEAFKRKMHWYVRDDKPVRKAAFTRARTKDGMPIIEGIVFHHLDDEIAYGVNTKGWPVAYYYKTGKFSFTPSVNQAEKIMNALKTRGTAIVHAQTGIPKDVLGAWKKQGHCGGI
ncbi:MAG TPA: hypothetical protein VGG75_06295 [Trebonia sp.]|jgi:hypothetical protein